LGSVGEVQDANVPAIRNVREAGTRTFIGEVNEHLGAVLPNRLQSLEVLLLLER
jgi:hypothetical protein